MQFGGLNTPARELRVGAWIDAHGQPTEAPLKLPDLGSGYKIIYGFQHWCAGCHSRGFPTLRHLYENLKDKEIGFAAIQTVFEGSQVNTFDKLLVNQEQYGLKIPFGHDVAAEGDTYPTFMQDYRTAGTPWFTVINPKGDVVYADFLLDAHSFLEALGAEGINLETA